MRILLIGVEFYSYPFALRDALIELGHEVELYILRDYFSATIKGRIYQNEYKNVVRAEERSNELYLPPTFVWKSESEHVLSIYRQFSPEIVIGFAAYLMSEQVLRMMSKSYNVLWIYDSIKRLPRVEKNLKFYDMIYTFEGTEVDYLRNSGLNAAFLPLCADASVYYPLKNDEKRIDISFAGGITKDRYELLKLICEKFKDKKIVICGRYIGFLDIDNQLVRLKSKEYRYFTNRNIDPVNLNKIYNESKICINIHQDQSRYGGNMRLYEVLAAGAFQIVDYNPYIEENFGKGLVTYKTSEDLMDTINYYLTYEDERNSIAKMGHGMVMNRDLFVNRAKTIIDDYLNKVNRK